MSHQPKLKKSKFDISLWVMFYLLFIASNVVYIVFPVNQNDITYVELIWLNFMSGVVDISIQVVIISPIILGLLIVISFSQNRKSIKKSYTVLSFIALAFYAIIIAFMAMATDGENPNFFFVLGVLGVILFLLLVVMIFLWKRGRRIGNEVPLFDHEITN